MDEVSASETGFSAAIVEDERDLSRMYQMILGKMKVPISFVAGTGLDAIIEFRACTVKPRVVLMDNRLPKMSGVEATRAILSMAPDTRIIFLSADSGAKDEAIAAGATLFLSKPARVSDIIDAVESARAMCPAAGGLQCDGMNAPIGSA